MKLLHFSANRRAKPLPSALRAATFPKGEGKALRIKLQTTIYRFLYKKVAPQEDLRRCFTFLLTHPGRISPGMPVGTFLICFPAGFPCARIESRGAWDPRLPREPAFFLLPSWHSPRVQYAPDGGNHARSGEELLPEQLLHSLESPRREGAFQVRLLQKCQEIYFPGIQVP